MINDQFFNPTHSNFSFLIIEYPINENCFFDEIDVFPYFLTSLNPR